MTDYNLGACGCCSGSCTLVGPLWTLIWGCDYRYDVDRYKFFDLSWYLYEGDSIDSSHQIAWCWIYFRDGFSNPIVEEHGTNSNYAVTWGTTWLESYSPASSTATDYIYCSARFRIRDLTWYKNGIAHGVNGSIGYDAHIKVTGNTDLEGPDDAYEEWEWEC